MTGVFRQVGYDFLFLGGNLQVLNKTYSFTTQGTFYYITCKCMNVGCILQNADRNSKKKPAQQSRDCCFCATDINMQRCLQMHE